MVALVSMGYYFSTGTSHCHDAGSGGLRILASTSRSVSGHGPGDDYVRFLRAGDQTMLVVWWLLMKMFRA